MVNICYIIGTAGSGKTILTAALQRFLTEQGATVSTVNLDPAVRHIPYSLDLDVRDYIDIERLVDEYDLGPNGALIAATDLIADHFHEISEEITDFGESSDVVLVDTPGQIELFAYRKSGITITQAFPNDMGMLLFLFDSALAANITGFISLELLASSVQLRLNLPILHVLTKTDLLPEGKIDEILNWKDDPYDAIEEEYGLLRELSLRTAQIAMDTSDIPLLPVSALTGQGLDLIAAELSRVFYQGKDWKV